MWPADHVPYRPKSRSASQTRFRVPGKKLIGFLLSLLLLGIAVLWGIREWLRPPVSGWRPVFQGVDYYCAEIPPRGAESGRVVALRLHLDDPSVSLLMRPIDRDALESGGQYILTWPDWERSEQDLAVLLNSAIYYPGQMWQSYPGQTVKAVDMVVVNGRETHFYPHSYLLWLDRERRPHVSLTKPPTKEQIADAQWGIGLQGVQVVEGKGNYGAIDRHEHAEARAFVGFHAERRELYLMAFENVTPVTMIDIAVELGVHFGGMLDSGNATWLILSPDAKGLRPWTGIRGGRPLGPYIGVRAKRLP